VGVLEVDEILGNGDHSLADWVGLGLLYAATQVIGKPSPAPTPLFAPALWLQRLQEAIRAVGGPITIPFQTIASSIQTLTQDIGGFVTSAEDIAKGTLAVVDRLKMLHLTVNFPGGSINVGL
jgi:hypothetical protein